MQMNQLSQSPSQRWDSGDARHSKLFRLQVPYLTVDIELETPVLNRYIKQTAQKLKDEFDSDVPKTVDELCSLPGVGPKMAFLFLQVAWNMYVMAYPQDLSQKHLEY